MWTRSELKTSAKKVFKLNYWKCVLVAIIFTLIAGGTGTISNSNQDDASTQTTESASQALPEVVKNIIKSSGKDVVINGYEYSSDELFNSPQMKIVTNRTSSFFSSMFPNSISKYTVLTALGIAGILAIFIEIFVLNVLSVGCHSFFMKNGIAPAKLGALGDGFKGSRYINVVLTMFLRDLFTILWSLLLIIPGIIKSYEYMMVPYILADKPELGHKEVFALSKEMMRGNKWAAFVLDLSFIGWNFLSAITFGIVGIFYVSPYTNQTKANLYLKLKGTALA